MPKAKGPRTIPLPASFVRHDGGGCPVDGESYVELLIRTGEGIGGTSVQRARDHVWEADQHEGGLGAIVAYRPAPRGEASTFEPTDRFKLKGLK